MGLQYKNLDVETRPLMADEVEQDIKAEIIYISNYLNDHGAERWPALLLDACKGGTDDTLARALERDHCFKTHTERRKPKGGTTMAAVPVTAAQTLAEAQFNMYYMRALARRAIAGGQMLLVYRAKRVEKPRPGSEEMIGSRLDPAEVLQALRETRGVEPPIGIPLPNTGITVELVK